MKKFLRSRTFVRDVKAPGRQNVFTRTKGNLEVFFVVRGKQIFHRYNLEDSHVNKERKSFRFVLFDQCFDSEIQCSVSESIGKEVSRKTQNNF